LSAFFLSGGYWYMQNTVAFAFVSILNDVFAFDPLSKRNHARARPWFDRNCPSPRRNTWTSLNKHSACGCWCARVTAGGPFRPPTDLYYYCID